MNDKLYPDYHTMSDEEIQKRITSVTTMIRREEQLTHESAAASLRLHLNALYEVREQRQHEALMKSAKKVSDTLEFGKIDPDVRRY